MTIKLPGWLAAAIGWLAGYLKGRIDQAEADEAAGQAAAAQADKTVEDAARQVGALSDDEVNAELEQWQSKA